MKYIHGILNNKDSFMIRSVGNKFTWQVFGAITAKGISYTEKEAYVHVSKHYKNMTYK